MSWVDRFYQWLFGVKPKAKAQKSAGGEDVPPEAGPSPESASEEETLYEHSPEGTVGHSRQHHWLFDEGVLHWNQRRRDNNFKPEFPKADFPKEAAKSRLWGRPADLTGEERVVLTGIDLSFADMHGATLTHVDLRHAKLQGANLRNANLASANLEGADLTDCDLRGAILDDAILVRAQLTNANLTDASLKNSNFAWADIRHMRVGSQGIQQANLFGAVRNDLMTDASS